MVIFPGLSGEAVSTIIGGIGKRAMFVGVVLSEMPGLRRSFAICPHGITPGFITEP
jgi:hypothetical protein